MRLYGKRFMANRMEARIGDRKESRDAVVYDIDETNRYCRVYVAGTDVKVRAWFPNNFMRSPDWLKVGVAVRIMHVGGDKSRIEVVSPGLIQPTQSAIPIGGGVDTVLLGMYLTAPTEGTGWTVTISSGSYRINGVSYLYNPAGGLLGDDVPLGDGMELGAGVSYHGVDPIANSPGLWFRYDAFAIGADGVVDYVKGVEWEFTGHPVTGAPAGAPDKPEIAADHVLIGNYILLYSGTSAISQANIGKEYEAPRPDQLVTSYTYTDPSKETAEDYARNLSIAPGVIYGGPSTYVSANPSYPERKRGSLAADMQASVSVTVIDQYGLPYSWWRSGSVNQLGIKYLGAAGFNGYGATGTGLGGPGPVPILTDDSGSGGEVFVSLGLGSSYGFSYTRQHTVVSQPVIGDPGYPSYAQADSDSHTAILSVRLVSEETTHPVSTLLTFWNLDPQGNAQ